MPIFETLALVAAGLFAASRTAVAGSQQPLPRGSMGGQTLNSQIRHDVERWRYLADTYTRIGVRAETILGVIARESNGNAGAVGATGDYGLMQITKPAWQDYMAATNDSDCAVFPDCAMDADLNVRMGSWFLSRKVEEMGNLFDGLRAYNRGTHGARENPNAGAAYAEWIVNVGIPAFRNRTV